MLFNSVDFIIFLPVVFVLYWSFGSGSTKWQNVVLLISSYFFYAWWDYRFLFLIIFSSVLDYFIGLSLPKQQNLKKRKILLGISLFCNLGLLGFFKYFNFFIENFAMAFSFFGKEISSNTLNIILPVGISFYTFQTLSYTIDVYRNKVEPTKSFLSFLVFVSFFPQLVAGPIERASKLLPQFYTVRKFNYDKGIEGAKQLLWGLFKKIVIADSCAPFVNDIFANHTNYSSSVLLIGAVLFAFQIYGDFSGYSDIAIGVAKFFGIDLMTNFRTPYFSKSIPEFWRRWHISLSTWFRDYLYIPLGGSQVKKPKAIRNIFIVFVISGFWHGANWTFIVWGALNALYYLPFMYFRKNKGKTIETCPFICQMIYRLKSVIAMVITFGLTTMAWVFFRSENIKAAITYLQNIFKADDFLNLTYIKLENHSIKVLAFYLTVFITVDWIYRNKYIVFQNMHSDIHDKIIKRALYVIVVLSIILSLNNEANSFIYFQF